MKEETPQAQRVLQLWGFHKSSLGLAGREERSFASITILAKQNVMFPLIFGGKDTATKDTAELQSDITDVKCLKGTLLVLRGILGGFA